MTTPPPKFKPDLKLVEAKCNLTPEAAQELVKRAVAAHVANPTLTDCSHAAFDCEIVQDGRLLVVVHHTMTFTSVFNVDPATVEDPDGVKFKALAQNELTVEHPPH